MSLRDYEHFYKYVTGRNPDLDSIFLDFVARRSLEFV